MWNNVKTVGLMALMTALLVAVGRALGGQNGMILAFLFAGVMNFASWFWSDKLLLRMYGAREISAYEAPEIFAIVTDLARRAEIPMPKVYLLPQAQPNAFATGRNPEHAAVAVTSGILRILTADELRGVLAHELGHVKNRDTLISTIVATMAGAISMIAQWAQWAMIFGGGGFGRREEEDRGGGLGSLFAILVAPFAAMLVQLAISRSREYAADAYGARLVGAGHPLASALRKLETGAHEIPAHVQPSTAHLFIVNPFGGAHGLFDLFRTHPRTEDRIRRLEEMRFVPSSMGRFVPA